MSNIPLYCNSPGALVVVCIRVLITNNFLILEFWNNSIYLAFKLLPSSGVAMYAAIEPAAIPLPNVW